MYGIDPFEFDKLVFFTAMEEFCTSRIQVLYNDNEI
jgi:hypothetical protein